jgi:hypothetical protein
MLAAAIQAFKGLSGKVKMPNYGTLVMRGGKINLPISKDWIYKSEIKRPKSSLQPDVITMWHYLEHDYTH